MTDPAHIGWKIGPSDEKELPVGSSPVQQEPAQQCRHRIADARNPVVKSGYICVDCGALFSAADHTAPQPAQHPDDQAVDRFAAAMKDKLAKALEKGRSGLETCPPEELSRMLREHVETGDPRDVANFAMMLWNLGAGITAPVQQEPLARLLDEAKILADDRPVEVGHLPEWALDAEHMIRRLVKAFNEAHVQQEPVAHFGSAYVNENGVHITTVLGPVAIPQDAKLYTSPPQRKPLTLEEIENIIPDDDTPMSLGEAFVKFTRLVEAAHNIKENT